MDYGEILSSGKKIKKIRKELGLKQHEITGGEVTRNLISIIENDKAALTEKVAKVIADNINMACNERNIDYHVSARYLLESEEYQAERVVDKYLENLAVDNLQLVDEIEEFLMIYDLTDKKRSIYEKIGDLYKEIKDYYKSYTYYIKAFEGIKKDNIDDMAAILILKLSNCCKLNHKYKEALEFCKLPLKNESFISMDIKLELLLNKAEILMLLKEYDSSLDEIESIEEFNEELSEEYLFTLNMLKGQCYRENRYYRDALEVYKSLKEGAGSLDKSKILCININIIVIYILLRDNRNIRKHIDESLVLISSNRQLYKEKHGAEIFSGLAKGFKFISEDERAAEYYNHAIYSAKRNKQYEILTDALENLFEIFEKKKALHEVDNIKNELLELISTNAINNDNTLIFKVIGFYNAMDDKESIEGIVSFILNHQ